MADMRISELTTAAGLHDGDLFETSQTDSISSSGYASYKTSLNAVAAFIAKQEQYSDDLQTTNKTLIGAINEAAQSGGTQSDWNEDDPNEPDYIKNKPDVAVIDDFESQQTASANPITLETKQAGLAKSCVVEMNPIQDLHGYSNPWAGGVGKNKLPFDISAIKALNTAGTWSGDAYTYNGVTYSLGSDGIISTSNTASGTAVLRLPFTYSGTEMILNGCPSGGGITVGYSVIAANSVGTSLGTDTGSGVTISASNVTNIIQIQVVVRNGTSADNLQFKPMMRLSTVTDATFAPYSNICPISGRTEASVTRTGKNVFGGQAMIDNAIATKGSASRPPIDDTNNTITINATQENDRTLMTFGNWVKSNTQYTFIFTYSKNQDSRASNMRVVYTDGTYTNIPNLDSSVSYGTKGRVKVTTSAEKTISYLQGINMATTSTLYCDESGIFEGSVEIADFEPYTAETHTHQYGQTVYGGVDDFVNGGLSNEWGYITSYDGETLPGEWISDRDVYAPNTTPTTGAEVVYKLATPTTIQLSPEVVTLLKGLNVISTDGDKVQVEFSDIPVGDYSVLLDYVKSLEARIEALEA